MAMLKEGDKAGIIRSTFVINPDGTIKKAYYNVKAKGHVQKLLQEL
jgi:peroxiredoxin Q/BCP